MTRRGFLNCGVSVAFIAGAPAISARARSDNGTGLDALMMLGEALLAVSDDRLLQEARSLLRTGELVRDAPLLGRKKTIAADYAAGRVLSVDGLLISRTEGRIALALVMSQKPLRRV